MKLIQVQIREADGELVAFSQRDLAPAAEVLEWAREYALKWKKKGDGRSVAIHEESSPLFLVEPERKAQVAW